MTTRELVNEMITRGVQRKTTNLIALAFEYGIEKIAEAMKDGGVESYQKFIDEKENELKIKD